MLGFKKYLEERDNVTIDIQADSGWVKRIDEVNRELVQILARPFMNSALFVNASRGTLERYGILLPAHQAMQQLSMEADVAYALGDTGYYVHMVHKMDRDGGIDGSTKIVTQAELDAIAEDDIVGDAEACICGGACACGKSGTSQYHDTMNRMNKQVRHSNDDSGNDDEY